MMLRSASKGASGAGLAIWIRSRITMVMWIGRDMMRIRKRSTVIV